MQSGDLRHRVDLVSSTLTPDQRGGGTRSTTTLATVWAALDAINGNEMRVADALRGEVTHIVTIRYPHGFQLKPSDRVVWHNDPWGDRTFVIKAIIQDLLVTRWLELHCQEMQ